ncbi:MAG TPA: phosphoenolpyruvate hydrolase family protein [Pseudorhizobium sp.]|jgi:predicted TIM-barrel enzyme|nr:phosphoenolpyruvate hydrolase family protein [Pseudorhizobium sp.]
MGKSLPEMRLPILARPPKRSWADGFILSPILTNSPSAMRDLLPLLPVADVNDATFGALRQAPLPSAVVAGLFLADPFLRLRDANLALAAAGVRRIANYPTVQLIDGDAARAFDSAKTGATREVQVLAAFRQAGFETIAFATTLATAQAVLRDDPAMLVLHPGLALADWRERANSGIALVRTISVLRGQTEVPLLVYRPHGFGHELDQAIAASDGIVEITE